MTTFLTKLENIFAATAFTDANNHNMARQICGIEEREQNLFENYGAAIAFSEANMHDEAKRLADLKDAPQMVGIREFEDAFAAAAFAEAGQFSCAARIAGQPISPEAAAANDLCGFISSVGLEMAPVRYVTVTL